MVQKSADQPVVVWVSFCIPDGLRQKDKHTKNWFSKEGLAREHVQ